MYRHLQWIVTALSLLPAATPTPSAGASGIGTWWTDATIIAALIGLGGVLIGVPMVIWTTRRNERLQCELATQNEKFQRELASQNEQLQRDLMQVQKALERQSVV